MEIKILGTGCPKCKRMEQIAREAVAEAGVQADITKVEDLDEIMKYPISTTPALVLDEEVKASGRVPRKEEVLVWIREAG